jgi:phosphatidylethanolamine/phosphatidyl-N-methylethanolamine N-methyltransferase
MSESSHPAGVEAPVRQQPRTSKWRLGNELSQRGYRLLAPAYDAIFGLLLQHGRRLGIRALACQPGDRVLEVCVGTGLSLPLYPPGVQVTGIDISREMLAKAAARVRRRRLAQCTSLLQMDAVHLAFADESFDKASMMFAVSGLPDPVRAMRELQRVCRPGATIVIASHFLSRNPLVRFCDLLLTPFYRLMRYRDDLDLDALVADAGLDVVRTMPANLFGYATVVVCRNRGQG